MSFVVLVDEGSVSNLEELNASLNEWLRLDSYKSYFNRYSSSNLIYLFHRLSNPNDDFVVSPMPADDMRQEYKRFVDMILQKEKATRDYSIKRLRMVDITIQTEAEVAKFDGELLEVMNNTISVLKKAEFITPILVVAHIDSNEGPHLHLLYLSHNTEADVRSYLNYVAYQQ